MDDTHDAPVAETTRNGLVECRHRGSAVVLGPDGQVLARIGEPEHPVYGRSSNKPLQASAMVRAGATLTPEQLAVAAASHSGGPEHLAVVRSILASVGLGEDALGNVTSPPLGAREAKELYATGGDASPLTMNCSGKHAAMLATCVVNGWTLHDYLHDEHPLQRHITETVVELASERPAVIGVDGCGAPAHALSLVALARAFGRIAIADAASPEGRVAAAIRSHPRLLGGVGRDVTRFLDAAPGWIAKDGADGVYAAAGPDGTAVAVKISDGAEAPRLPVLLGALRVAGVVLPPGTGVLERRTITGGGRPVGELRATF